MEMVVSEKYVVELEKIRQFMVVWMQNQGLLIADDATFEDILDMKNSLYALPTIADYLDGTLTSYTNNDIEFLDDYAFYNNDVIEEIYLNNVKNVGGYTFDGASALESISLNSVNTLYGVNYTHSMFENNLKNISMQNVISIGSGVFNGCSLIGTGIFNLPKLQSIYSSAFYGTGFSILNSTNFPVLQSLNNGSTFRSCPNLTEVNLPSLININGDSHFRDCPNLTEVNLPSLTNATDSTFRDCPNLTEVNLPSLINAGVALFYGCSSLIEISLPSLITINDGSLFQNDSSLEIVYLPKLLYSSRDVFNNCTSLQKISLPRLSGYSGYTPTRTFYNCQNLEVVDYGNVSYIYENDFVNDIKLSKLILRKGSVVPLSSVSYFNNTPFAAGGTGGTVYVPQALISQYGNDTNWSTLSATFVAIEGSDYEDLDWYGYELIDEGIIDEL